MRKRPHRTALDASYNTARRMYWEQRLGIPVQQTGRGKLNDAMLEQIERCADDESRRLLLKFSARSKKERREPKPIVVKPPKPMSRTVKIELMLELAKRVA